MIIKNSRLIKRCVFLAVIIIAILFSFFIMVRYEVEGEKELPFYINKILIMSTVNGKANEEAGAIWDLNLIQNNDLYIYINKNENTSEILKKITIENFQVIEKPNIGEIKIYRPTGELSNLYTYSQQNYINDKLEFNGSAIDDLKVLEISNQGGVLAFRIATENIGKYVSDSDSEVIYNGSLLSKSGIKEEDIKFSMSFDIIIEIEKGVKFKGTVNIDLPSESLIQSGTVNKEITDFSNVIFKRIK